MRALLAGVTRGGESLLLANQTFFVLPSPWGVVTRPKNIGQVRVGEHGYHMDTRG